MNATTPAALLTFSTVLATLAGLIGFSILFPAADDEKRRSEREPDHRSDPPGPRRLLDGAGGSSVGQVVLAIHREVDLPTRLPEYGFMSYDAIVDEVRAARDAYAKRFNYDLEAICRDLREQQAKSGRQTVSFAPRPAQPVKGPAAGQQ